MEESRHPLSASHFLGMESQPPQAAPAPAVVTPTSLDMPQEYLHSVRVQSYDVDLTLRLHQEVPCFSGRVRISVHVLDPPRNVFYLHSAGLHISHAMIGGVPAKVIGGHQLPPTRATRFELPKEAPIVAAMGDDGDGAKATTVIDVKFSGSIRTREPEGLSMLGPTEFDWRNSGGTSRQQRSHDGGSNTGAAGACGIDSGSSISNPQLQQVPTGTVASFPLGTVLGTHLEPTHARDLFPCIDLPSCKAVFHLTLRGVPAHLQAISNAQVWRVDNYEHNNNIEKINDHQPRTHQEIPLTTLDGMQTTTSSGRLPLLTPLEELKTVVFRPTPIMPTYILGFWVGDFRCLTTQALATEDSCSSALSCWDTPVPALPSGTTKAVTINVHVLREADTDGASFALQLTRRAFELFSRLFVVPFPLPKLDVLGLPRMHGLGMENFGAITLLEVCARGRFPLMSSF